MSCDSGAVLLTGRRLDVADDEQLLSRLMSPQLAPRNFPRSLPDLRAGGARLRGSE